MLTSSDTPVHLCIGSARSGTTWLFNNLHGRDDIFVPCVKEVRFWYGQRSQTEREATIRNHRNTDLPADQLAWLERWSAVGRIDSQTYLGLMRHRSLPALDISPTYALLPADRVPDIARALPAPSKVIYFVRNPLDRAMSQFKLHAYLHGKFRGPAGDGTLLDFARKPAQRARNNYAKVIGNWQAAFGDRFKVFNYDDLAHDPDAFFRSVTAFLGLGSGGGGLHSEKTTVYFGTDRNQKTKSIYPDFTPRQQSLLAELTLQDALDYASVDQKTAQEWAQKIRSKIQKPGEFKPTPVEVDWRYERFLRLTESLGDNCEFGFFQRFEGYEPSSLLRWTITPSDALLRYLKAPVPLFERDNLRIVHNSGMVLDSASGFSFHTDLLRMQDGKREFVPEPDFSRIYQTEKTKIDFLLGRFNRFIVDRPGVFVIKSNSGLPDGRPAAILAQLRRRHPRHSLLCVSASETYKLTNPQPGLYFGTVPTLARYTAANEIQHPAWKRLILDIAHRPEFEDILTRMFV